MKIIQNILFVSLFILSVFPKFGLSQQSSGNQLNFEVNKIYPYISISKADLRVVNSIADLKKEYNDLNLEFDSSWIKEYISVEVSAYSEGKLKKIKSQKSIFTPQQHDLMNKADVGSMISVQIDYLPKNTLMSNDKKEISFSFIVNPESDANYNGGRNELTKYLKINAIDKISADSFKDYDLAAIKFTIDEEGKVNNAHIFGSEYSNSKNEEINALLLEVIQNMPCWKPAEYSDGTMTKQEFVLTVGNMENCLVHVLGI